MDLSYAQNLEDYHLARVFADCPTGFYIDVGAGHPVADNVSFWFYLQGWRGIVVEPQGALADLYAHVRPRDVAIRGLLGARTGEAAPALQVEPERDVVGDRVPCPDIDVEPVRLPGEQARQMVVLEVLRVRQIHRLALFSAHCGTKPVPPP